MPARGQYKPNVRRGALAMRRLREREYQDESLILSKQLHASQHTGGVLTEWHDWLFDLALRKEMLPSVEELQEPDWKARFVERFVAKHYVHVFKEWAETFLKVPDGPLRLQPFYIPPWQERFMRDAFKKGVQEAGLSVARKNGKSGLIAAAILCFLVGPWNVPQWRAMVTSLTARLSSELRRAVDRTAIASELVGVVSKGADNMPGKCIGHRGAEIGFIAADKATGHATGADLAIIDEAGLLQEKNRELWGAMFSSMSGRNGRFLCISVRGDCPMFNEMEARKEDRSVVWHEYKAPENCDLDDVRAWHKGNPGLKDGIKSLSYMEGASRKAIKAPADESVFRSLDLNQPQDPNRELIISLSQWKRCMVDILPVRQGPCFLGFDIGLSNSMTAGAAYWPTTGRLEVMAAFGDKPNMEKRGKADGVGRMYAEMVKRGELIVYPSPITPVGLFVQFWIEALEGTQFMGIVADRFKKNELAATLKAQGIICKMETRGMGFKDGAEDVREFQRAVLQGRVHARDTLLMLSALKESSLDTDAAGNKKIDKSRQKSKIDALVAAVLAVSAGERYRKRTGAKPMQAGPTRPPVVMVV